MFREFPGFRVAQGEAQQPRAKRLSTIMCPVAFGDSNDAVLAHSARRLHSTMRLSTPYFMYNKSSIARPNETTVLILVVPK